MQCLLYPAVMQNEATGVNRGWQCLESMQGCPPCEYTYKFSVQMSIGKQCDWTTTPLSIVFWSRPFAPTAGLNKSSRLEKEMRVSLGTLFPCLLSPSFPKHEGRRRRLSRSATSTSQGAVLHGFSAPQIYINPLLLRGRARTES